MRAVRSIEKEKEEEENDILLVPSLYRSEYRYNKLIIQQSKATPRIIHATDNAIYLINYQLLLFIN